MTMENMDIAVFVLAGIKRVCGKCKIRPTRMPYKHHCTECWERTCNLKRKKAIWTKCHEGIDIE